MRQSGDQVEADLADARVTKNPRRGVNIIPAMHSPGGLQLRIRKRLNTHADAIESRITPGNCFLRCNRLRVGCEGHFIEFTIETRAHGIDHAAQIARIEKAGRTAAEIYGIDYGLGDWCDYGFMKQPWMLRDLAAHGVNVGR